MPQYSVRTRILYRILKQCQKLLGPNHNAWPVNESYIQCWNRAFKAPGGGLIPWEVTDIDNIDPNYPLTKEDLEKLGDFVPDGLNSRIIQLVQLGTSDWKNLEENKLLPCIFIENADDGITVPAQFGNTHIGEIMPVNISLLMVQPPDSMLTFNNSNPVLVANLRDALDYLLDPFWFKGLSEKNKFRRGYSLASTIYDATIVSAQNLEGVSQPYERVDFRLQVTFERQKQIDQLVGFPNELKIN